MRKRIRTAYFSVVNKGSVEESMETQAIKAVLPRIRASAKKVGYLAFINRKTHATRYDLIIGKATKSFFLAQPSSA